MASAAWMASCLTAGHSGKISPAIGSRFSGWWVSRWNFSPVAPGGRAQLARLEVQGGTEVILHQAFHSGPVLTDLQGRPHDLERAVPGPERDHPRRMQRGRVKFLQERMLHHAFLEQVPGVGVRVIESE